MMIFLSTISEALLYTCFALLMGSFIFQLIPPDLKPEIIVPKKYKLMAVIGIILFSFIPVLNLLVYLVKDYNLTDVLKSMLLTFEVGKAWIFTLILSIVLGIFILLFDRKTASLYPLIGAILLFLLIIGVSWTSHAHSVYGVQGLLIHLVHFGAVVVWVGILLVVSWFSRNKENWLQFLGWFHITAIFSFAMIVITGLYLMRFSMELNQYPSTWVIPYGQSLLIKHLLILPLMGYALINGVLMKKKLRKSSHLDPRAWTKLEFFIILLIFAATGALGQQQPPSPSVEPYLLVLGLKGISLGILSALFLILTVISFVRKMPPLFSFIMSVLVVICAYLALMLSIQII